MKNSPYKTNKQTKKNFVEREERKKETWKTKKGERVCSIYKVQKLGEGMEILLCPHFSLASVTSAWDLEI